MVVFENPSSREYYTITIQFKPPQKYKTLDRELKRSVVEEIHRAITKVEVGK